MLNLDTILPLVGLKAVPFGSTPGLVRDRLGKPEIETTDEWGDLHLEYPALGITFTFWRDDGLKLGVISTVRETALLCDAHLVGQSDQAVREFIRQALSSEVTEEDCCVHDDGRIQSWVDVDSHMITFWFENQRLYCIDWFCGWADDSTPSWPVDNGRAE